jgi:hypothetical protein
MKLKSLAVTAIVLAAPLPAAASSDDVWAAFKADVRKACISAAKDLIQNGKALVDDYGSEHYGLAIVSGKAVGAEAAISTICVFDKKTKRAEIGGEISADRLTVKATR